MQALHASTSGRTMGHSRGAAAGGTSRRVCVKVQAVATTAGNKTVLAPPYNVLITGSTKGGFDAQQLPVSVRTLGVCASTGHLLLPQGGMHEDQQTVPCCTSL
jgi:hypothetical protein